MAGRGPVRALGGLAVIAGLVLGLAGPVMAQDPPLGVPVPMVLVVDQERLFAESRWGKRALQAFERDSVALAAENRRLEAELTIEEKALTEQRATMPPEDFRPIAEAFDAKVVELRRRQDGKSRDLTGRRDNERLAFYRAAVPVVTDYLRRTGAMVVIDARAVFLAVDAADATEELVRLLDAALGEGKPADTVMPDAAPEAPTIDGTAP